MDDDFVYVVRREPWPNPRGTAEQIATFFGENARFGSALFCHSKIWEADYRWWISRECVSRSKEARLCATASTR